MGRGPKLTFLQREHSDAHQTHAKMLNIMNYQANANQNHNEISLRVSRMAIVKNITNKKCWRRRGEKETLVHYY